MKQDRQLSRAISEHEEVLRQEVDEQERLDQQARYEDEYRYAFGGHEYEDRLIDEDPFLDGGLSFDPFDD